MKKWIRRVLPALAIVLVVFVWTRIGYQAGKSDGFDLALDTWLAVESETAIKDWKDPLLDEYKSLEPWNQYDEEDWSAIIHKAQVLNSVDTTITQPGPPLIEYCMVVDTAFYYAGRWRNVRPILLDHNNLPPMVMETTYVEGPCDEYIRPCTTPTR